MEYDFEKLGKEIVVGRLREVADPYALAGEAARKIAVAAVTSTRGKQEPKVTVAGVCRGVMSGMVLIEKDLPKTAVALLTQMAAVANETGLDPAECMTWAMEGIAPVVKTAHSHDGDRVRAAIEENFMGAGEVFDSILRTSGA
ncbi:MAG: hypothetical protein HY079_03180 [Elusimicrobia bacterium]|nr:hypothetical protein [Elusimicrobiota bacterium]